MALTDKLSAIGNAIRAKTGKSAKLTLDEMPSEIASIEGGGGSDNSTLKAIIDRSITSITIPNGMETIGTYAFYYASALTSVTIPSTVTKIDNNAFASCTSLESFTIPDTVTSIGSQVFYGCSKLASCYIGTGITAIPSYMFSGCGFTSLVIPDHIRSIAVYGLYNMRKLESLTLPASVSSIGSQALYSCKALKKITCLAETPPTIQANTLQDVPDDCIIEVLASSVEAYKAATNWSVRAAYIQAITGTVTLTGEGAYYDDMTDQSNLDYSIDGGETWLAVVDAYGDIVTEITNATQIQFRINDNLLMIYNFYITMGGVRTSLSIDDSGTVWYTENVTLTGDAKIEYELS